MLGGDFSQKICAEPCQSVMISPWQSSPSINSLDIHMKWLIRLFFKTLRLVIGPMLILTDWLTSPKAIERQADAQQQVDQQKIGRAHV